VVSVRLFDQGVLNFFAIARPITFIFMNYGGQQVQDIFCIVTLLLPHPEPSLLLHVCLAVFLLNIAML